MKPIKQVTKEHYDFKKYIDKQRWMSYYYQLKHVYELKPSSVLEIGAGNNFLKKQLSKEITYKVMDIAKDLNPDVLGGVDNIPLKNNSFDLVCCFQVLEHLPFNFFEKSLKEIARVSKKKCFDKLTLLWCPNW
ncbi:class I SAM-dependent methyltransferase [Candidatus Pacearchaeota archaeon]|nr:class I SAM-dependent methyltransferase [Candidatus Pacearchaeota archaeon]